MDGPESLNNDTASVTSEEEIVEIDWTIGEQIEPDNVICDEEALNDEADVQVVSSSISNNGEGTSIPDNEESAATFSNFQEVKLLIEKQERYQEYIRRQHESRIPQALLRNLKCETTRQKNEWEDLVAMQDFVNQRLKALNEDAIDAVSTSKVMVQKIAEWKYNRNLESDDIQEEVIEPPPLDFASKHKELLLIHSRRRNKQLGMIAKQNIEEINRRFCAIEKDHTETIHGATYCKYEKRGLHGFRHKEACELNRQYNMLIDDYYDSIEKDREEYLEIEGIKERKLGVEINKDGKTVIEITLDEDDDEDEDEKKIDELEKGLIGTNRVVLKRRIDPEEFDNRYKENPNDPDAMKGINKVIKQKIRIEQRIIDEGVRMDEEASVKCYRRTNFCKFEYT